MKQIKLAVLAVGLLIGAVGAYGTSKKTVNLYYVTAGARTSDLTAVISATSPAPSCNTGTSFPYVCRISTGETYSPNDEVWLTEVSIFSTYNQ